MYPGEVDWLIKDGGILEVGERTGEEAHWLIEILTERDGRERWRKEIYWTVEVVVQTEIPKREVVHWLVETKTN